MSGSSDHTIGVIGLGHVGLPTALCLAELGWKVFGADHDQAKIAEIKAGQCPIFEPGLQDLLLKHLDTGLFTPLKDVGKAVKSSSVLFICVGTPQREDGEADLSQVETVARTIARNLNGYKLIVEKSTVPIQSAQWINRTLILYSNGKHEFDVASNPEFLREGTAIEDFLNPDRIVLGVGSARARSLLLKTYEPLLRRLGANGDSNFIESNPRLLITDISSAEAIKHASNAFLAMKISFINMMADLCESIGADVNEVAQGIGLDSRIGPTFLQAGIGYGGYCLRKDIRALSHIAKKQGLELSLLEEVDRINEQRLDRFMEKVRQALWVIQGKTLAILGLAFKPGTDDIRDAPSLKLLARLLDEGASIRVHDPKAMPNVRKLFPEQKGRLEYAETSYAAVANAHALLLVTEWEEYRSLDMARVRDLLEVPVIVDGRNLYDPDTQRALGFEYYSMGRA